MDELCITPISSFSEFQNNCGKFYDGASTLLNPVRDIRIVDASTSNTLLILRKNVLQREITQTAIEHYQPIIKKLTSSNRGLAAGHKPPAKHKTYDRSNPVHSTIAGYIDSPNNKYPCRLSQFSSKHFDIYTKGIPLIESVNALFKETLPLQYERQLAMANTSKFRIKETAFSTVTINYNFQTALHVDKGDCEQGFGVLVVSTNQMKGGYLLFPRFDIGICVSTNDVLFMNVHEYHCNSPITPISLLPDDADSYYRMSFVFYFRTRLLNCRQNEVLKELGVEDGKYWNTSLFISKITDKIGTAAKQLVFEDTKNWVIESERYKFVCKNRQYKLYDKDLKKQCITLQTIWVYLNN